MAFARHPAASEAAPAVARPAAPGAPAEHADRIALLIGIRRRSGLFAPHTTPPAVEGERFDTDWTDWTNNNEQNQELFCSLAARRQRRTGSSLFVQFVVVRVNIVPNVPGWGFSEARNSENCRGERAILSLATLAQNDDRGRRSAQDDDRGRRSAQDD